MVKNTHRQINSIWSKDRALHFDNPYYLKLPGSYFYVYESSMSNQPGHEDCKYDAKPGMIRYNLETKVLEVFLEYSDSQPPDDINGRWLSLGLGGDYNNPQGDFVHRFGDVIYGDLRIASNLTGTINVLDEISSEDNPYVREAFIQGTDVRYEPAILNAPGSPEKPSYSFDESDKVNDTGMYRADEDVLGFSTKGNVRAILNEEGLTITTEEIDNLDGTFKTAAMFTQDGNKDIPGYTFLSNPDTGIFRDGEDSIGVSINQQPALYIHGRYTQIDSDTIVEATDRTTTSVTVPGELHVFGNTTNLDTTNLIIEDNIILLNKNEIGIGISNDYAGIEIKRGTLPNVSWLFDEINDWWGPYGPDGDINTTEKQLGNINEIDTRTTGEILYVDGNSIRLRGPGSFGSESEPAYSWEDDPDTGIFRPATDSLGITVGSNNAILIEEPSTLGLKSTSTKILGDFYSTNMLDSNANLSFSDNIIILNKNETGSGITTPLLLFSGIEIDRGTLYNTAWLYDETNDWWGTYGGSHNVLKIGNINEIDTRTAGEILYIDGNSIRLRGPGSFGSESAPAFSWDDEPNTGIFRPDENSIGLSIVGTEEIRIDSTNVLIHGTGALKLPSGNLSERPLNVDPGMIRYNNELKSFEYYDGIIWGSLGGSKLKDLDKDTKVTVEDDPGINNDQIKFFVKNEPEDNPVITIDEHNTTFNNVVTFNKNYRIKHIDLGLVNGTINIDPYLAHNILCTLSGDITVLMNDVNLPDKYISFILWIKQGSSLYSVQHDPRVKWPDNGASVHIMTQKPNAIDMIEFCTWDNGATWYAKNIENDFNFAIYAFEDTYSVQQWETLYINESSLTDNDVSPSPPFSIISVQNAINSNVSYESPNIVFESTGLTGEPAGFDYTIQDSAGVSTVGHVIVNITPLPPIEAYMFESISEALSFMSTYDPPTFETVFNTWHRFCHGGSWSQPATASDLDYWDYEEAYDRIRYNLHSGNTNGLISNEKLENYVLEARITANDDDSGPWDCEGIVLAFNIDDATGREHTLTAFRSAGHSFLYDTSTYNNPVAWAIVYDHNLPDEKVLMINNSVDAAGEGGYDDGPNWNWRHHPDGAWVKVTREGDIFTCITSNKSSDVYVPESEMILDLNSDPVLEQFKGKKSYGYAIFSQPGVTFTDVTVDGGLIKDHVFVLNGTVFVWEDPNWVEKPSDYPADTLGYPRVIINPLNNEEYYIDADKSITKII